MTQSGGGEYSLGTATLTMRGDMQPLERDLARMRAVIAEMEKRGTKIPAPNIPPPKPPPPETQRGYEGLLKTIEALRRGAQGDGEAFTMLSQQLRGAGQAAAAAGGSGGFGGASGALGGLLGMAGKAIPGLGQLGLAAAGVQAIFGGLQGAVNAVLAPLQQLSAEAGRLNKQVAEAGIFAAQSFAILGPDGKLVEGTARQMQMVRGAILKEYKGIQQEVANISGATASEIYDGFNIILQNISALGEKGTLENSAKLATRMAAGMNTLGIPAYQLRQEVNALMMGNIDRNAMMATKLGITGEDVRQQQAQGTYYDFLMKKLEKLYEGQKVLALSLANVKSNFDDVNQAIASESGQPLERDTAQMMQTILVTFKNLQGSFTGFFKSIAEAVGPIIKMLGPVVSVLTSIGAIASSVGRIIMDVAGVVTSSLGVVLQPILVTIARTVELIAKGWELVADAIGGAINPIKALLNVSAEMNSSGVNTFFDQLIKGAEGAGKAIDGWNKKWAQMVLNKGLADLRSSMKQRGASEKEIQAAEIDFKEGFKTQTGLTEAVELRSLQLDPKAKNYIEELNNRLGTGSTRALNISKEWADIKQKAYQNEIKALEQGLTLMNKQKELAEAMSAAAAARRALEARGYELGVQVAASPEAKAAAEARLADLKLKQEKEAIAERRGILQTERELQQRQMQIQEKQIKIQQEQLKIQLAEARADQVRVDEATKAAQKARGNTKAGSPEWQGFTRELNVLAAERTRNTARVNGAREALRYAFEAEGQVGTLASLQAQVLGLQEQQLDIQGQSAQYTREQQRLLAEISAEEQRITNTLTRATTEQNRKKQALEDQREEINQQNTLLERQSRLEKAQADLATTRAKSEVQAAQRLAEIQELQDRARSGGGTASVIEAQIAAAAAGVSGMETAAQVQERLYQAKEQQMNREHALQQRQLEVQQKREESELRIQRIRLQSQQVEATLQRAQIMADIARLTQKQRQDAIAPQLAGASSVPALGSAVVGGIGNMLPGTKGGPNINEGVGARGGTHQGQDLGLDVGDPIHARRAGQYIRWIPSFTRPGNRFMGGGMVVKYDNGQEGVYGHVEKPTIPVGTSFAAGQKLATVYPDGNNTHLHYELRDQMGRLLNPLEDIRASLRVPRQGGVVAAAATAPVSAGAGSDAPAAPVLPPPNTNPKLLRIMQAARGAGFQGEDLIRMTAVAMAESSGNVQAFNNNARTGDLSYGAFQVNMRGDLGPDRRRQFGLPNNEALFDLGTNARVAKGIFDSQGINAWGSFRDGRFQEWMGQARAAAPSVMGSVAAAGGAVAPSTALLAQALQQRLADQDSQDSQLVRALDENTQAMEELKNIFVLQKENLTEQQLAERAQFEYERVKAQLTAQVMKTPEGRLAISTGDAVSSGISSSVSGALQALLNGGDVKQAVSSALAQVGQSLMQATLDALLNPLLGQLQNGIVKAVTGIDIQGSALQMAATAQQGAASTLVQAAGLQINAATALMAAAGAGGVDGRGNTASTLFSLAAKIPSLIGGFAGLSSGLDFAAGFSSIDSALPDYASLPMLTPTTPGRAGGGEIEYGLDYLVGERNAEIVRFNKAGGKVFSNRALTKALGVPFQRAPGGATTVAEGGGDAMGIPFLKARPGGSSGSGAGAAPMARSSALRLSVDTQVINGVEYATVEQVRQAAAAAAQAGRDSVAYDLRNSPSFQRSVGMG